MINIYKLKVFATLHKCNIFHWSLRWYFILSNLLLTNIYNFDKAFTIPKTLTQFNSIHVFRIHLLPKERLIQHWGNCYNCVSRIPVWKQQSSVGVAQGSASLSLSWLALHLPLVIVINDGHKSIGWKGNFDEVERHNMAAKKFSHLTYLTRQTVSWGQSIMPIAGPKNISTRTCAFDVCVCPCATVIRCCACAPHEV